MICEYLSCKVLPQHTFKYRLMNQQFIVHGMIYRIRVKKEAHSKTVSNKCWNAGQRLSLGFDLCRGHHIHKNKTHTSLDGPTTCVNQYDKFGHKPSRWTHAHTPLATISPSIRSQEAWQAGTCLFISPKDITSPRANLRQTDRHSHASTLVSSRVAF